MKVNIMRLPEDITEFGKTDTYSVLMVIRKEEAEAYVTDIEQRVTPSAMQARVYEMMRAMAEGAGAVALYNEEQLRAH